MQLARSMLAVKPCPRRRQKFVWFSGGMTWWHIVHEDSW
jgi:hypothetical protein